MKYTYTDAILRLRPEAIFTIKDNEMDTFQWFDTVQTAPTEQEIKDECDRLNLDFSNKEYQRKRQMEYPDFKDYLDGVVKGDQSQIQAYIDACLAVKNKYPKT
jgi:hypothetical protein